MVSQLYPKLELYGRVALFLTFRQNSRGLEKRRSVPILSGIPP
jgi:hypothetical protein